MFIKPGQFQRKSRKCQKSLCPITEQFPKRLANMNKVDGNGNESQVNSLCSLILNSRLTIYKLMNKDLINFSISSLTWSPAPVFPLQLQQQ